MSDASNNLGPLFILVGIALAAALIFLAYRGKKFEAQKKELQKKIHDAENQFDNEIIKPLERGLQAHLNNLEESIKKYDAHYSFKLNKIIWHEISSAVLERDHKNPSQLNIKYLDDLKSSQTIILADAISDYINKINASIEKGYGIDKPQFFYPLAKPKQLSEFLTIQSSLKSNQFQSTSDKKVVFQMR